MIEAEIPPEELRELMKDLKGLRPEELLKGELLPFVKVVGKHAGKYAPPVNSPYVRTGHLGRSWYYNTLDSLSAEVGNFAKYAGYVHGPRQIDVHRGHGWKRLFEIGEAAITAFIKTIEIKAERIWRS
jgi:hypothetical protein